jgi:hypothetical protein
MPTMSRPESGRFFLPRLPSVFLRASASNVHLHSPAQAELGTTTALDNIEEVMDDTITALPAISPPSSPASPSRLSKRTASKTPVSAAATADVPADPAAAKKPSFWRRLVAKLSCGAKEEEEEEEEERPRPVISGPTDFVHQGTMGGSGLRNHRGSLHVSAGQAPPCPMVCVVGAGGIHGAARLRDSQAWEDVEE